MTGERRLPPRAAVRAHWAVRLVELGKADSVTEALEDPSCCFACCMSEGATLERAHITARVLGGSDDKENLHLLCPECHRASEMLEGDAYWKWFRERNWHDCVLQRAALNGVNLSSVLHPTQGALR